MPVTSILVRRGENVKCLRERLMTIAAFRDKVKQSITPIKGHIMPADVSYEEIEESVRRNLNTFHRHDLMTDEEIVEEVTNVINDDLMDGYWFLSSFKELMTRWDDGSDHFVFIQEIADVYREFFGEDLVSQVIRHYHDPLLVSPV